MARSVHFNHQQEKLEETKTEDQNAHKEDESNSIWGTDSTIELVDVEERMIHWKIDRVDLKSEPKANLSGGQAITTSTVLDTRNSSIWTAGFDVACDIVFMTDRFHEVDGCLVDIQEKEPLAGGRVRTQNDDTVPLDNWGWITPKQDSFVILD